jgi:Terminase-like family.
MVTNSSVQLESAKYVHLMKSSFTVGIDLGQSNDPTAFSAVERLSHYVTNPWTPGSRIHSGFTAIPVTDIDGKKPPDAFHIRALERLKLGVSYLDIASQLAAMLGTQKLVGARVFIDATGVGRPVCDLLRSAGIKHTAVTITGGRDEHQHGNAATVSKLLLISKLQAVLHSDELKIADELPEAKAFMRELQEFRVSWTAAGNIQFGARQGAHDDLVLAAALAIYGATRSEPAMDLSGIKFAWL